MWQYLWTFIHLYSILIIAFDFTLSVFKKTYSLLFCLPMCRESTTNEHIVLSVWFFFCHFITILQQLPLSTLISEPHLKKHYSTACSRWPRSFHTPPHYRLRTYNGCFSLKKNWDVWCFHSATLQVQHCCAQLQLFIIPFLSYPLKQFYHTK